MLWQALPQADISAGGEALKERIVRPWFYNNVLRHWNNWRYGGTVRSDWVERAWITFNVVTIAFVVVAMGAMIYSILH